MEYTFKVWIDGNYYDEDEKYDVDIDLSDEEYVIIKRLVDEYGYDCSRGLMPIIKSGPEKLYNKFYRTIFPHIFFKVFSRDNYDPFSQIFTDVIAEEIYNEYYGGMVA